jgi:hypothetical protein
MRYYKQILTAFYLVFAISVNAQKETLTDLIPYLKNGKYGLVHAFSGKNYLPATYDNIELFRNADATFTAYGPWTSNNTLSVKVQRGQDWYYVGTNNKLTKLPKPKTMVEELPIFEEALIGTGRIEAPKPETEPSTAQQEDSILVHSFIGVNGETIQVYLYKNGFRKFYINKQHYAAFDCVNYADLIYYSPQEKRTAIASYKNGKWGVVHFGLMKVTIPVEYDYVGALNKPETLIKVLKGTTFGLLSLDGKEIIPCRYTALELQSFVRYNSHDYTFVAKSTEGTHLVWLDGKENLSLSTSVPNFDHMVYMTQLFEDKAYFEVSKNNLKGLIDGNTGKIVLPVQYNKLSMLIWDEQCLVKIEKNKQHGFFDLRTGIVIEPKFKKIEQWAKTMAFKKDNLPYCLLTAVDEEGKAFYVDRYGKAFKE